MPMKQWNENGKTIFSMPNWDDCDSFKKLNPVVILRKGIKCLLCNYPCRYLEFNQPSAGVLVFRLYVDQVRLQL